MSTENMTNLFTMDKESLLKLLVEKDRRIQDLEQLVEDQRRLRLEDSNQVEEKAARIKEWVTNKLKELENQNKQLRDQNKKQKETVDSLTTQLASLTPNSSPRKRNTATLDKVQYIDQAPSPVDTIDVAESLKTRRPQLKKSLLNISTTSTENGSPKFRIKLNTLEKNRDNNNFTNSLETGRLNAQVDANSTGISLISIGGDPVPPLARQDSPLYDSVNFESQFTSESNNNSTIRHKLSQEKCSTKQNNSNNSHEDNNKPPPPPLHHYDKWELQLYNLADQTFSAIVKNDIDRNDNYGSNNSSRKSSTSQKNDLFSVAKPSFTTIDGDQVIDSSGFENNQNFAPKGDNDLRKPDRRDSNDRSSHSSVHLEKVDNNTEKRLLNQNLFDSPMRSRSGKDSILRTQSVRKNPTPEKLYDFICADLTKRGYLVKTNALRNHTRWFVLRDFTLFSFKREADEAAKDTPTMTLKLDPTYQVQQLNHTSEDNFPFKLSYQDKSIVLIAENSQIRDEWIRILTVAINLSDIDPGSLTKTNSNHEGVVSVTRNGHMKRSYAVLINHVLFFLKSPIDPTPLNFLSVKGSKVRELTDNFDYDFEEKEMLKQKNAGVQDCSLAIYPRFSLNQDPVYLTLGNQQDTDGWLFSLIQASGIDQYHGTQFEKTLTRLMINSSLAARKMSSPSGCDFTSGCLWKEQPIMMYIDRPIIEPLTSLPNETLRIEALELFKSILLFTQVPLEPIAIDYHVCLLQNCLGRFLKYPELRNEFFAQLIKQSTYVVHRCHSDKLSSSSSGCSIEHQRLSFDSLSPSSGDCRIITDLQLLKPKANNNDVSSISSHLNGRRSSKGDALSDEINPPSQSELLQVMQILAVAVSLNLPRGRLRWWLIDHLRRFANPGTNIGKHALYTLNAIERTSTTGPRDNVPSRTEIMSILLRNPYDHSKPHSLPVSFADGSYLVVGADGSTTVEEFMETMSADINIRNSLASDFYLFSDDPSGLSDIHILEPQRKILDVVGWWEQTSRQHNSGRYKNTQMIKLMCRKRLPLRGELGETDQERLLIVHQLNQEIITQKIPLSDDLASKLGSILAQLTFGDYAKALNSQKLSQFLEKVQTNFLPNKTTTTMTRQLVDHWQLLNGRSGRDCVRVYLNCIRRLNIAD